MAGETSQTKISIVVPIYNESEVITELLQRLAGVVSQLNRYEWELVAVDDGSQDDSVAKLLAQASIFPGHLVVRQFSRNFGHQAALMAGLEKASGDAVIIIDADLQDPPELFPAYLEHFEQGADVVYGVRRTRKASWYKHLSYKIFYWIFKKLADIPIPLDAGDFGLMSHRAVSIIRQMPEKDILLRGLRCWVGFKQVGVPYDRPDRAAGETKYSLKKLIKLAMSAFFGYSSLPLRVATNLGFLAVFVAILYGTYALYVRLVTQDTPSGWTSLAILVLFFGGTQLISVGILGEYIARIYKQALNRPLYVVAEDRVVP